jgi:hypothetical protein
MRRCSPLINQIEAYAKRERCTSGRICDRKSWLNVLDADDDKNITTDKEVN